MPFGLWYVHVHMYICIRLIGCIAFAYDVGTIDILLLQFDFLVSLM